MYSVNQEGAGEKTNIAQTRGDIEKTSEEFMTSEDVTLLPLPQGRRWVWFVGTMGLPVGLHFRNS